MLTNEVVSFEQPSPDQRKKFDIWGYFDSSEIYLCISNNITAVSLIKPSKEGGFNEGPYHKNSKNWDTWNNYHNCPTIGTVGFYSAVLCSKDADRITNREDPDQTAPWGAVWSGSALFAQAYLSQYLKLLR